MKSRRIVIVEDDESFATVISRELERGGWRVRVFADVTGVCDAVHEFIPNVMLLDLRLAQSSGLGLLRELRMQDADVQVVVLTAHGAVPDVVEAMRLGAYDFLTKPVQLDILEQTLARAVEKNELLVENRRLRREVRGVTRLDPLFGESPAMVELRQTVLRVAQAASHVLILGENGTGKELVARCLHGESRRVDSPFVAVNCGAIPTELVESELFGHEAGAFTGANRRHRGLFESAHGGTLFLDEIGELPLHLQPALLRAVQSGEVRRVGGREMELFDVRVLAATNRDLADAVACGQFREDLFYRLSALQVDVPPLRDREEDVVLLARRLLAEYCAEHGRNLHFADAALLRLRSHDWPGNVRELQNVITRVGVLANGPEVGIEDLDELVFARQQAKAVGLPTLLLDDLERLAITEALERCGGDKKHAARQLGIALKTLYNKLARYDLRDRYVTTRQTRT
ncbi:MAG: sigma-54-dependent Fis family transcriptional regulator [Planctomycetes bacterium]|nr:sigma-54-dependent Fis family transcriptional regulator [Planctomycetota bacterium]